jgi:hypothetical protein
MSENLTRPSLLHPSRSKNIRSHLLLEMNVEEKVRVTIIGYLRT